MQSHLRSYGDLRSWSTEDLARRTAREAFRRNVGGEGRNISEYRAVANQAANSAKAGALSYDTPLTPIDPYEMGVDSRIGPGDPLYRYDVLVRSTQPDGSVIESVVVVRSSTPLSPTDLYAEAVQAIVDHRVDSPGAGRIARNTGGLDIWVVNASRGA